MSVISRGYLTEESSSSAIYTIVIDDFREKLAAATVGGHGSLDEAGRRPASSRPLPLGPDAGHR